MKSQRERTTEASAERGPGGSVSTSCFESDGSDCRAKHLLSASPAVSVHSVRFSCPLHLFLSKALWAEASASVPWEGNGPGRREGRDCPGSISCTLCKRSFLQLRAIAQSPTSHWLALLLPHSLGLNTFLLDLLTLQAQAQCPPGRAWPRVGMRPRDRTEAWRPWEARGRDDIPRWGVWGRESGSRMTVTGSYLAGHFLPGVTFDPLLVRPFRRDFLESFVPYDQCFHTVQGAS